MTGPASHHTTNEPPRLGNATLADVRVLLERYAIDSAAVAWLSPPTGGKADQRDAFATRRDAARAEELETGDRTAIQPT